MKDVQQRELPRRRPVREVIPGDQNSSVRFAVHDDPHPYARWNFHPEYEVHLILASTGRYVIGDAVGSYRPGQLTLLGPNLPHQWIADRESGQTVPDAHAVVHFSEAWIRSCQAVLPELHALDGLLRRSARGLEFQGDSVERGADAFRRIRDACDDMERVVRVLDLLRELAATPREEIRPLVGDRPPWPDEDSSALVAQAIEYILDHLTSGVHLHEAAQLAAMSDSSFSRYFKAASGRTFTDMVRDLRLTQARRLLESTDEPIARIASNVGYANLSNFNRQFRRAHGVTPRQYRRSHTAADT